MLDKIAEDGALKESLQELIQYGEGVADGLLSESIELFKTSAAGDPTLSIALSRAVDHIGEALAWGPDGVAAGTRDGDFLLKLSGRGEQIEQGIGPLLEKSSEVQRQFAEESRELWKQSFIGDFRRGFENPDTRQFFRMDPAPAAVGGMDPMSPGLNPFREYLRVDPREELAKMKRSGKPNVQFLYLQNLTPEQRLKQGVYFAGDERRLMDSGAVKLRPRNVNEASLIGFAEGHNKAVNNPGIKQRLEMLAARRRARNLGSATAVQNVHANFGVPVHLAAAQADASTRMKERVTRTGQNVRRDYDRLARWFQELSPRWKLGLAGAAAVPLAARAMRADDNIAIQSEGRRSAERQRDMLQQQLDSIQAMQQQQILGQIAENR
jgi:hypothetical protein